MRDKLSLLLLLSILGILASVEALWGLVAHNADKPNPEPFYGLDDLEATTLEPLCEPNGQPAAPLLREANEWLIEQG